MVNPSVRAILSVLLLVPTASCGLLDGGPGVGTEEQRVFAVHLPQQVNVGKPVALYVDADAACHDGQWLTASVDDGAKVIRVRLLRQVPADRYCSALVVPTRLTATVALQQPATYRVEANWFETKAMTVEALPAGEPVPEWTPPPFQL